ncbi:methyltransferase, FxLD system [Streptomyces aidingensis]|nr:methyltransferase, FxLD system [Streptomyces aidingensis]
MNLNNSPEESMEELREALVGELRKLNAVRSEAVAAALRRVPRHLFVPEGVTPEQAYAAERAEVTKRDEHGVAVSSVSAARVQAMMLEQADIRPGMRVLEIGSGGYNAALIAEMVGPEGEVTTIDIDPDVTDRARRLLDRAGYERVHVVCTDGEAGEAKHAPYDRIIVTVGAWDIPPAWTGQLADGGRIVVPLRVRGLTRSVSFQAQGEVLVSTGYELCGFVPMQGSGEMRVQVAVLHDEKGAEVGLRLDDEQEAEVEQLREALKRPRAQAWSGVTIGGSVPFDDLDLWLATEVTDYALLAATPAARDRGLVASASPLGTSTLLYGDSFAYRAGRPVPGKEDLYEFGAYGHGPNAEKAAQRLVEKIQAWDREHRDDRPTFYAHPADTPIAQLPHGLVVIKKHRRITISWPAHNN